MIPEAGGSNPLSHPIIFNNLGRKKPFRSHEWSHDLGLFVLPLFYGCFKRYSKLFHHRFITTGHYVAVDFKGDGRISMSNAAADGGDRVPIIQ